nr:hypothetical protein [uncultured Sphaerochaeta sp.]
MAIELEITTNAHLEGLKKAQAKLEEFGRAGESVNKNLKFANLDVAMASIRRNFNTEALFPEKGLRSAKKAIEDVNKAMKAAEQTIGKGGYVGWLNPDGKSSTITKDLTQVQQHFSSLKDEMTAYYDTYAKATTKKGMVFDYKQFNAGLDKQAEAISMFGTDLQALEMKMGAVKEQGIKMVTEGGDPEQIKKLSDEYKNLSMWHERIGNSAQQAKPRVISLIKSFVSAQAIVWAIRTAFTALTTGIKEASDAAAAAEQVFNKFETVFDGMGGIEDTADAIAKTYGMAESSAKEALASIADMYVGMGASQQDALRLAEELTGRITDIMAFKDMPGTIVSNAQSLMSGIAGNTENFRRYGSIIKEAAVQTELLKRGQDGLTGTQLELAKAMVRQDLFLRSQINSIGATAREWENMASINRRYEEQMKIMKENQGQRINTFFKPMKEWILSLAEAWNTAFEAQTNYMNGEYNPVPEVDFKDTKIYEVMLRDMKRQYGASGQIAGNAYATNLLGDKSVVDYDRLIDVAKRFGVSAENAAMVMEEAGFTIADSLKKQAEEFDNAIIAERNATKARIDARASAVAFGKDITAFRQGLAALIGGSDLASGVNPYFNKDLSGFAPTKNKILGINDTEDNLDAKKKELEELAEWADGIIRTSTNQAVLSQAKAVLGSVKSAYQDVVDEIESIAYDKNNESLREEIANLQYRNELTRMYGEESSDIVNLLISQKEAEQEAWQYMKERVEEGMKANVAHDKYLEQMEAISEQYKIQLDFMRESAKLAAQQKVDSIITDNNWQAILKSTAEAMGRRSDDDLVTAYVDYLKKIDDTNKELADQFGILNNGMAVGLGNIDLNNRPVVNNEDGSRSTVFSTTVGFDDYFAVIPQVIEGALVSVDEAVEHYLKSDEHLGIFKVVQKEGETLEQATQRTLDEANAYARVVHDFEQGKLEAADALNEAYELTKEQLIENYKKTVEDARKAMYDQLGDVGMVRDWVEGWKESVFYALQDGKTQEEAEKGAWQGTWEEVLMEFAMRLDTVNELFSLVSETFDQLAPIVDDFLAPFLVLMEPTIEMLNMFVPILTLLFPIIKNLAMALNFVATTLNWFSRAVEKVVGELTFWTSKDDVSWGYVNAAWAEGVERNERIMDMEIEARADYVTALTDAQKAELDTYKDLYNSGLLTLSEYTSLSSRAATGRNYDAVSVKDISNSGTTVSYGDISITVSGAEGQSPEDIAKAVKVEIDKLTRRNTA